jgi:phosphoglycolate phosphatase-like HAD superfamily hydrolase
MNMALSAWEVLCITTFVSLQEEVAHKTIAAEGCRELLGFLKDNSARIGILTRNLKSHAKVSLEKMGVGHFVPEHCILGRHEARPKPDPEGIVKLMQYWNAAPQHTVMVLNVFTVAH